MVMHHGIATSSDTPVTDLATWLSDRPLMTDVIRQHLNRAKQSYVQSSLAQRSNQKLAFKFFGPYRILARVGNVAYRLELPASSSVSRPTALLSLPVL